MEQTSGNTQKDIFREIVEWQMQNYPEIYNQGKKQ